MPARSQPAANDDVRQHLALLLRGRWFAAISAPLREALLDAATLRSLPAGARLFGRGEPADGLYAVLRGALLISGVSEAGRQSSLLVLEPPSWFGEIALFDGGPRTHDAQALQDALLLHVPSSRLDALLAARPQYWRELGLLLADKLRRALLAFEDQALLGAGPRLARRLLMLAEGFETRPGGPCQRIALSQEQLAMMVAVSRQTANQLLKALAARGIVSLQRGGIEILDPAGLRAAAALD